MKKSLLALGAAAASTLAVAGCSNYGGGYGQPAYSSNSWDPVAAYRDGNYSTRTLADNDEIYRGSDGRYYCKRNDGTTGLIIGGIAGGVLGNIIAPGGSKTLGTIIGAAAGAAGGTYIDRNNVQCR